MRVRPGWSGPYWEQVTEPTDAQGEPTELADLVQAIARDQDRAAFSEVYRRLAPSLRRFLITRCRDAVKAEEVLQETMLTVWRKAGLYDRRKASVNTWAYTIARNRLVDRIRKERRPEPDPEDPAFVKDQAAPDEAVSTERRARRLREALDALPDEQAAVLRSAYFDGLSQTEVAAEQGVPLGTVKSRARLAIQRLRDALGDDAPLVATVSSAGVSS